MSTQEILLQLTIGGLLGLVGQILRVTVGIKKMNEEAIQKNIQVKRIFETNTLINSLLIGFTAGVLATVSISTFKPDFWNNNLKQTILTLIASGYAGTDFIEGFIRKYIPKEYNDTSESETDSVKKNKTKLPKPGGINQPNFNN